MMPAAYTLALYSALSGGWLLPDGGRVDLELTTDREVYHVGEPVHLKLTVRNAGDTAIFGYVLLQPYLPSDLKSAVLLYCRSESPCVEFLGKIPHVEQMDMAVTPIRLSPGGRERSDFVVALNPETRRLVLEEPGDYEFRWVTWGIHDYGGASTRVRGLELSASASVRVLPVPEEEQQAFAYYAKNNLGELAQFEAAYAEDKAELRLAARTMLRNYPGSIYAEAIRRGLLELLEIRALHGRVSSEEQALLAELRARRAER